MTEKALEEEFLYKQMLEKSEYFGPKASSIFQQIQQKGGSYLLKRIMILQESMKWQEFENYINSALLSQIVYDLGDENSD